MRIGGLDEDAMFTTFQDELLAERHSDELLYQLARCLPWLLLGVEAWVTPVWTEGFAE